MSWLEDRSVAVITDTAVGDALGGAHQSSYGREAAVTRLAALDSVGAGEPA